MKTPSVEAKLQAVEKELKDTGRMGTLEAPGEYVDGLMPMRD